MLGFHDESELATARRCHQAVLHIPFGTLLDLLRALDGTRIVQVEGLPERAYILAAEVDQARGLIRLILGGDDPLLPAVSPGHQPAEIHPIIKFGPVTVDGADRAKLLEVRTAIGVAGGYLDHARRTLAGENKPQKEERP